MLQPTWNTPAGTIGTYASGAAVNFTLNASSNSGVYNMRYVLQSGTLPPGLTLNTYLGTITGIMGVYKTDQVFTFTIRAIDGAGNLRDRTFNTTVSADLPPNFVTPTGTLLTTLDSTWLYQGIPYTTSISDPTVDIVVLSGQLPPGVQIDSNGLLHGYAQPVPIPTQYKFTLRISNSIGSNTREYNIIVNPTAILAPPNQRIPTILNNQPLFTPVPTTDPYYGYYRVDDINQFTGSIATTPGASTIEGSIGSTVGSGSGSYTVSGNTLHIARLDGWVDPGTEILSQLTGVPGGPGTYRVNTPQNTSTTNIYSKNDSTSGHTTFTGSITGDVLTVTGVLVGTMGPGLKLYTPRPLFIGDTVSDGTNTATVTGVPEPDAQSGAFTLSAALPFTGPLTITSNKLVVNTFNSGTTILRGDTVLGASVLPDTYIVDQWSGTPGALGTYVVATPQVAQYNILSIDRAILTVTGITSGSIELNRNFQTTSGTGVVANSQVIDQITPLLPGETLGGLGRYTVSRPQTLAAGPLILDTDIGTYYYDDYFSFKVIGHDFSALPVTYQFLPPVAPLPNGQLPLPGGPQGLTMNPLTGWITGTPVDAGTQRYDFTVVVTNSVGAVSEPVTFGVTFSSVYSNTVRWITPSLLGTIENYKPSMLSVVAGSDGGSPVKYRIISGTLPPQLELLPSGLIVGRTSFNPVNYNLQPGEITPFTFTVEAYTLSYPSTTSSTRTFTVNVLNRYTVPVETVYLKCTPPVSDRRKLIGGLNSLFSGSSVPITTVVETSSITNYLICESTAKLVVGSVVSFGGTVFGGIEAGVNYWVTAIISPREFQISTTSGGAPLVLEHATGAMQVSSPVINPNLVFRAEDPYFGVNEQIRIDHIYGVNANEAPAYIEAVTARHYKRRFTLGELKTAVARDESGNILYEVVYSTLIDNLYNNDGISINYEITWPTQIPIPTVVTYFDSRGDIYTSWQYLYGTNYYTSLIWNYRQVLYPNSLQNMEISLVSELGRQADTTLMPLWMTSQQMDGGTTGYVPAWVICYTKPGCSEIVRNNILQLWPFTMNQIDFEVDRVYVDKTLTFNYNSVSKAWSWLPTSTVRPINIIGTVAPNVIITNSPAFDWYRDLAFTISSSTGTAIGGLDVNTVYYVRDIDTTLSPMRITISRSLDGYTEILSTAGLMSEIITATPLHIGPQPTDSKDYMILYDDTTIIY